VKSFLTFAAPHMPLPVGYSMAGVPDTLNSLLVNFCASVITVICGSEPGVSNGGLPSISLQRAVGGGARAQTRGWIER
jgi:hypothetical protein